MIKEALFSDFDDDSPTPILGFGNQGTIASHISCFEHVLTNSEFTRHGAPSLDIYEEFGEQAYRTNPFLRELERKQHYLLGSEGEHGLTIFIDTHYPLTSIAEITSKPKNKDMLGSTYAIVHRVGNALKHLRAIPQEKPRRGLASIAAHFSVTHQVDDVQKKNEFYPSDALVNLILLSRQDHAAEQDKVLEMLHKELEPAEFDELNVLFQAESSKTKEQREEIRSLIEQEIRLFVETIGNLGFDQTSAKHFLLTKDHAAKFLPSIENALLLPFDLTTDCKPPFLRLLLEELTDIADTRAFCTAHGKLSVLNGELVVERQKMKAFDLFSSDEISQQYVT